MTSWVVIVCQGFPGTTRGPVGQYLQRYDPEAFGGRGDSDWTNDVTKAIRFSEPIEALDEWRRVPTCRPVREDGRPNRPLTAFTVEMVNIESKEEEVLTHLRRPDVWLPICGAPYAVMTLDVAKVDCTDCWRLTADPRAAAV